MQVSCYFLLALEPCHSNFCPYTGRPTCSLPKFGLCEYVCNRLLDLGFSALPNAAETGFKKAEGAPEKLPVSFMRLGFAPSSATVCAITSLPKFVFCDSLCSRSGIDELTELFIFAMRAIYDFVPISASLPSEVGNAVLEHSGVAGIETTRDVVGTSATSLGYPLMRCWP